LLLFCAGNAVTSQTVSFKTLFEELQSLQKQLVPDKRVAILEIEIKDTLQAVVVVSGETDLPDAKKQIINMLTEKNVAFTDSIRLLPNISAEKKPWALATLSVSNLRANPQDASELVTQAVMGTPLKVLECMNKWCRVQTPDKYIGWMDIAGLQQLTTKEMQHWQKSKRYMYNRITGVVINSPDKNGEVVSDLVIGDFFEIETTVKGFLEIKIPDGRKGYVLKSDCVSLDELGNTKPDVASVISVAKQMMGFPYLWGGTSGKAIDCSGFTKTVYFSQGVILARDASQQARYGEPVDFKKISNLQPGDLLFFGRNAEHITHVGLYLGSGDFIHSSGKVYVSSIDPDDQKYIPERNLVVVRRILNSVDTEGIVRVKNHSWYY